MELDQKVILLERYQHGFDDLAQTLRNIPESAWSYRPAVNAWSIREIIVHVSDSEVNGFVRARKIIAENGGTISAYDQDKWASALDYQSQDLVQNLALINLVRKITSSVLNSVPVSAWNNYMMHPERGKMTLTDWLKHQCGHIDVHIKQIERTYRNWLEYTAENK